MIRTPTLRLAAFLTLALAASLGTSNTAHSQATKPETKAKAKEKGKTAEAVKGLIDLNSATSDELQSLPGIGAVHARKIIDSRPHKTVADLAAHGVPASTIDKIKPLVEVKALPAAVDVNADSIDKLETLPGIGPVLAKEIVAARPHTGYESIAKLKGIGEDKLDALKGRLKFGTVTAKAKVEEAKAKVEEKAKAKVAETKDEMPKTKAKAEEKAKAKVAEAKAEEKTKSAATPKIAPGTKVNINTATREVLDELPGIGPVKAQAILDFRAEKKFETIEDIMKVKGIKEGEFGKIKDMITVK